jgi:CRP-like cAMP-binding protein
MIVPAVEVRPFARKLLSIATSLQNSRALPICSSSLLDGISWEDGLHIAELARVRLFTRDELIFMQGQPAQSVMLVMSGMVKLTQLGYSGNEVILWIRGEREPLEIEADHTSGCYVHNCSARAVLPTSILVWERSQFRAILQQHPRIADNVARILSTRLEELQDRFREVATEPVSKRFALELLRLMQQIGKHHPAGTEVPLSREEMAQLVGTSIYTVSRLISKWVDMGLVLARREAVVICNPARLRSEAERECQ